MKSLELLSSGLVFRNPQPAVRSAHAYFPTAVELSSGELLVGMDIGSAFEAADVRSYTCRSLDGGVTWTKPEIIFQPDESRGRVSTTCRIGASDREVLLGWACLFDRSREEYGLGNPETEGFCKTEFAIVRSQDAGRSWSSPQSVELPTNWQHFETCAPLYRINGCRLLALTSPWSDWEGKSSPWKHNGIAFLSNDNGETWDELVQVFQDDAGELSFYEQAVVRLTDGRLAAMCWVYDRNQGRSANNRIALSNDDGRTFGPSRETELCGETCRLLALQGNRLLVIYRRVDKPGLWAQVVAIDGDQWNPQDELLLWNGLHAAQPLTRQGTISVMGQLKFGCPAVVQLQDGEVFVVFWCVEDCVSNIRWLRLRVR